MHPRWYLPGAPLRASRLASPRATDSSPARSSYMATQMASPDRFTGPPLAPFELDTLPKLFFDSIEQRPRPDALRFKRDGEWRSLSHAEIEKRVAALAAAFAELGIERGDRVAVLSENR